MTRVQPRWCAALAAMLVLLGAQIARGEAPGPASEVHFFAADTTEAGVISLDFFGAKGAPVVFYERIGDRRIRLGRRTSEPDTATTFKDAVIWRCDRLFRRFEAASTLPGGTHATGAYSVRTPSCATRLQLGVPRRLAPGDRGTIRVVDRWGNGGVSPQLCITPPGAARDCARLRLRRAITVATSSFRATTPGRWRVELRIRGHRVRRSIAVGEGSSSVPPPTVLATGDSMMQGIDSFLADELGDSATVHSDVQPGTGISKPRGPWATLPATQVKRLHPAATVIAIGAVDGFPLPAPGGATAAECCGAGWIAGYTSRVRDIMLTYRRKGRGRVVWLTLPIPKGPRDVADAVNFSVVAAATGLQRVSVLRLDELFTPDGFREVMPYRGRDVRVRAADGIHLNVAGTAIAARVVAGDLRRR